MQYFVSLENTSYFYWQIELLIESFKMLGINDNLIIAFADNNEQKVGGFSANIVRHEKKFLHENIGRKGGYLPLNRTSAILSALSMGILKPPFVLIHSDMILVNPVEDTHEEVPAIMANNIREYSEYEDEIIKKEVEAEIDRSELEHDGLADIPFVSFPMVFNTNFRSIAEVFFGRLHSNCVSIFKKNGSTFPCERAAWALTLKESSRYCAIAGRFLSAPLLSDLDSANFIHYRNGIPPVFNKKFYRYENGMCLSGQGPYETILENNISLCTDYMHKVIKSYASNRYKEFRKPLERQTCPADDEG